MDRFLVSLFPLLRRFAGFLVRSFFRASFPYFFRLKKGLVSRVGTKQPCFQKLEEIGAEDRGGEKGKFAADLSSSSHGESPFGALCQ